MPVAPRLPLLTLLVSLLLMAAHEAAAAAPQRQPVDTYNVRWTTPSHSSLGAMPVGNGRTSANVWVDAATGDLMALIGEWSQRCTHERNRRRAVCCVVDPAIALWSRWAHAHAPEGGTASCSLTLQRTMHLVGLADALDENSNLLKLGRLRLRTDPPLWSANASFSQTLVLSTGTIEIKTSDSDGRPLLSTSVWVDAHSSDLHVAVAPVTTGSVREPKDGLRVTAVLENWRLAGPVLANYGNGWAGSSGSFCYSNGSVADNVYIYPDRLAPSSAHPGVLWYHLNSAARADFFRDALVQQGLSSLVGAPGIFDPLTNRTWGAALQGFHGPQRVPFSQVNETAVSTAQPTTDAAEVVVSVFSGQVATDEAAQALLQEAASRARTAPTAPARAAHVQWWTEFFNRSYIHVQDSPAGAHPQEPRAGPSWVRHNSTVGDQTALLRNESWPVHGESPGACTVAFPSPLCVQQAAAMCLGLKACKAYALSTQWQGGMYPQLYRDGAEASTPNPAWTLFDNTARPPAPPPPPPPPPPPAGFLVSRQSVLMRYMDLCSSGRIGGGNGGKDFFALKFNGGLLTSESPPLEDSRNWGPGQWWQNFRLPYYAMLRSGDLDMFKPLLRWYLALLPLARARAQLWYGSDHPGILGAWFIETTTQFGTFVPSEKGYHCPAVRDPSWPVWWGGNKCINLHRVVSVEVLVLGLDYWDHTQDTEEFATSILPLSVAVTDWVRSFFGNTTEGVLDVWPTQSLEGYEATFPPTRTNIIANDQPIVAGLHAVLPRLLVAGAENNVSATQLTRWAALLKVLPPLPVVTNSAINRTVFTAAQQPYAPNATHSGTETPMMYPVHPFRLATVMHNVTGASRQGVDGVFPGYDPLQVARDTYLHGGGNNGNLGWNQQVMNLAYMGLRDEAAASVAERARTPVGKMRFPAYLPSMQDSRPNEDHLSNMRIAVQAMLVQHGDGESRNIIGMLPAWPCDTWSATFKVHLPLRTVIEGSYDHVQQRLVITAVTPSERAADIRFLGCVNHTHGFEGPTP